jgi:hypothetical protein
MIRSYRLGNLPLTTAGSGELRRLIDAELESIESHEMGEAEGSGGGGCKAGVAFDFPGEAPVAPGTASYFKPVRVWPEGYVADHAGIIYKVENHAGRIEVTLKGKKPRTSLKRRVLPSWLRRAHHWNYFTPLDEQAKDFMYNIFDYLTQIGNLEVGQTYVHASSFHKGDRAVGIFAWGGIGKTTAMLKMVMNGGWKFLSDDLGLLDAEGYLWRSPKRMQIYAYNLAGQPKLREALMRNRSVIDRSAWEWRRLRYGTHQVRRRVSAEEIFGDEGVGKRAVLTDALFAERVEADSFSVAAMTPKQFSERCAAIVMSEIEPFSEILTAVQGAGYAELLPSYQEMLGRCRDRIAATIDHLGLQPFLWRIPKRASPEAIHEDLERLLASRKLAKAALSH